MPDWLSTAASVVLGVVFVVAGGSKIAAWQQWMSQARGLGVPRPLAAAVPAAELVLGALLIVQLGTPYPALVALAMLVSFTALIALRLHQGQRPPCACFGSFSAKPIGPANLIRNAVLIIIAVVAAL